MQPTPIYKLIAQYIQARETCEKTHNTLWHATYTKRIDWIMRNRMPSGSGIDSGTKFNWDKSKPDKLVLIVDFHHMNDGECYNGWTAHEITVRPWLADDFYLSISGRDRNEIKDYLYQVYKCSLRETITESEINGIA